MNYKLEKFWNHFKKNSNKFNKQMNYKLEKFWNHFEEAEVKKYGKWTINLKSFEIMITY